MANEEANFRAHVQALGEFFPKEKQPFSARGEYSFIQIETSYYTPTNDSYVTAWTKVDIQNAFWLTAFGPAGYVLALAEYARDGDSVSPNNCNNVIMLRPGESIRLHKFTQLYATWLSPFSVTTGAILTEYAVNKYLIMGLKPFTEARSYNGYSGISLQMQYQGDVLSTDFFLLNWRMWDKVLLRFGLLDADTSLDRANISGSITIYRDRWGVQDTAPLLVDQFEFDNDLLLSLSELKDTHYSLSVQPETSLRISWVYDAAIAVSPDHVAYIMLFDRHRHR